MRYLVGHDAFVLEYLKARVPDVHLQLGTFASMGVVDKDGKMLAGVVFFNYRPWDVEIGIAADSPRWCTRKVLNEIFSYCFNQLGVKRVSGMQAVSNERAHKLVEGLGFQKEGVLQLGWFGREDAWLYGMTREQCRWIIGEQYGIRRRQGRGRKCA